MDGIQSHCKYVLDKVIVYHGVYHVTDLALASRLRLGRRFRT
jgi:hypothetical protein